MSQIWVKMGNPKNIRFTTLRIFNVIGIDQFKINIFLKLIKLKSDEKLFFNHFNVTRDFIFINDCISILIKLMLNYKNINYNTINIGTGIFTKISYLIELMSKLLNRNLINNIVIKNNEKLNFNYANINRLKKIIHYKQFKSVDEIIKTLIKNKANINIE